MQVEIKIDNSCKETKVIVVTDKITDEINTLVKKTRRGYYAVSCRVSRRYHCMEQYAAKQPENPDERVKGNIRSRKIHEGSGTFVRKRKKRAAERHAFPQKRKEEKKKR